MVLRPKGKTQCPFCREPLSYSIFWCPFCDFKMDFALSEILLTYNGNQLWLSKNAMDGRKLFGCLNRITNIETVFPLWFKKEKDETVFGLCTRCHRYIKLYSKKCVCGALVNWKYFKNGSFDK